MLTHAFVSCFSDREPAVTRIEARDTCERFQLFSSKLGICELFVSSRAPMDTSSLEQQTAVTSSEFSLKISVSLSCALTLLQSADELYKLGLNHYHGANGKPKNWSLSVEYWTKVSVS